MEIKKRRKVIAIIVIGLLVVVGIIGGKMYMAKQTHNQRIAEMANKLRIEGFELEIAKQFKTYYKDIKSIDYSKADTSQQKKTGFWHTSAIVTTAQGETRVGTTFYGSIERIKNNEMMGSMKTEKYLIEGETKESILVILSNGKRKEI